MSGAPSTQTQTATQDQPESLLAAQAPARLVVLRAPELGPSPRLHLLSPGRVATIGRDHGEPGLVLQDAKLSRVHARVAWDPLAGCYRVGDAGSRNGLFVNRNRIQTALLRAGDVIRVGECLLTLDRAEDTEARNRRVESLARSDLSLLLHGETGVGKEVLARRIHEMSGRPGPFLAINCAAVPADLIASELFGYVRGAFSGAQQQRAGMLKSAAGGTLLLDEIGDMPLQAQSALLRVLQERRMRPVGADREEPIDVRVLAATHVDLLAATENGRFRMDLLARLSQDTIVIPPLRERKSELLMLLQHLGGDLLAPSDIDCQTAELLLTYPWPRNVRELDSLLRVFAARRCEFGQFGTAFLMNVKPELSEPSRAHPAPADPLHPAPSPAALEHPNSGPTSRALIRSEVLAVLEATAGNLAQSASRLGVSRQKLYRFLEAEQIDPSTVRQAQRS